MRHLRFSLPFLFLPYHHNPSSDPKQKSSKNLTWETTQLECLRIVNKNEHSKDRNDMKAKACSPLPGKKMVNKFWFKSSFFFFFLINWWSWCIVMENSMNLTEPSVKGRKKNSFHHRCSYFLPARVSITHTQKFDHPPIKERWGKNKKKKKFCCIQE